MAPLDDEHTQRDDYLQSFRQRFVGNVFASRCAPRKLQWRLSVHVCRESQAGPGDTFHRRAEGLAHCERPNGEERPDAVAISELGHHDRHAD